MQTDARAVRSADWRVWSRAQRPYFFFQAEDGIRDYKVTGVQTCALPISEAEWRTPFERDAPASEIIDYEWAQFRESLGYLKGRSEERRVGKECRSRWSPYH